ncbi:hypothetical protein PRZ48_014087 [Zasmidium cellare]|uniref:F-box domain-containing protein n=1 Tax=Zasmidium cellare TaxID=395010 RepID=A0ABR0DZX4_ZASCE|nr:hypothetical protein PRZ48_014087 [Zasmidium cellare]
MASATESNNGKDNAIVWPSATTPADDTSIVNAADSTANTTTPATDKLFNTVELLEAILLGLDFKTLLLSQAVNKTFAGAIASSIKLQRAIHFAPNATTNHLPIISKTITTPEAYRFRLHEFHDGAITFFFDSKLLPTREKPATGSWRKIHARARVETRRLRLSDQTGMTRREIELPGSECTFGAALDALLFPSTALLLRKMFASKRERR